MHVHGLIQPLKYIHLEVDVYFTMIYSWSSTVLAIGFHIHRVKYNLIKFTRPRNTHKKVTLINKVYV